MAAFSYQLPTTFLLDSIFLPNTSKFQESSCVDDHNQSENGNSLTRKHSTDSSTVSMVDYSGEQVSQQLSSIDKKRNKTKNSAQTKVNKILGIREGTVMCKKQKKWNGNGMRKNEKKKEVKGEAEQKVAGDEPSKGYIHVRARRGQATDSHSLAERVRRERISDRMKILQKLVPGCDKVTGKAFMLDEIINYVQSLQNQVEFLSLKLAALSPMLYDFGLDAFTIRPEGLNGLAFGVAESNSVPNQSTAFSDAAAGLAQISPHLLDASLLLHPGRTPNVFTQNNGSQLWDVDNHRQNLLNSAGSSHNLCSFH